MNRSCELALAVLSEAGIIEADGAWWKFKPSLPAETRAIQEPQIVDMGTGRLPWLMVREVKEGDYFPKTKQGRVFCAVKMALGLDWRDRDYDKAMYARSSRALNQLIGAFSDEQECAEFVLSFGDQMKEAGISNWGIDAIVRSAYNSKGQREAKHA